MPPWFPDLPPPLNEALLLGVLLVIGGFLGVAAQRGLKLPAVFGYALAGFAVGPLTLDLPVRPLLEEARVIVDIAVGLVLFELGRRLDVQWLRRDPLALDRGGCRKRSVFRWRDRGLDRVRLSADSCRDGGGDRYCDLARGRVARGERRACTGAGYRSLPEPGRGRSDLAFLLTTMLVAMVHFEYRAGWLTVLLHPLYLLLVGSLALGIATGFALPYAAGALTAGVRRSISSSS